MRSRRGLVVPVALGLVAFVAFARATPRQAFYGDVAQFQVLGLTGGLAHSNGYSTYLTLANLFSLLPIGPLSEAAYRTNLLSAVFGGLTVGLLALLVARWSSGMIGLEDSSWTDHAAGLLSGLVFATLGTTWALATVASPYTLDTAATLVVLGLVSYWSFGGPALALYAGLLVWGASFGAHNDVVLLAPGVAVLALARRWPDRRKLVPVVGRALLALLGGLALYVGAWAFQDSRHVPHDFMRIYGWIAPDTWISIMDTPLKRFVYQVSNQEWQHAFMALPAPRVEANLGLYLASLPGLFTPVGVALIAVGLVFSLVRRRPLGLALLLVLAAQLAFWLTYDIPDLPKHLLPSYLVLAISLGLGGATILRLLDVAIGRLVAGRTPWIQSLALVTIAAGLTWLMVIPGIQARLPVIAEGRPVDYEVIEWHVPPNLELPEASSRAVISGLPEHSVVFAGWRLVFTFAYVANYQEGRDDLIFTRPEHYDREVAVRRYAASRPVYFVDPPQRWLPPDLFTRLTSQPPLWALDPP